MHFVALAAKTWMTVVNYEGTMARGTKTTIMAGLRIVLVFLFALASSVALAAKQPSERADDPVNL